MCPYKPSTKSLRKSAASGTRKARRLSDRYAPPNRATAAMEAMLGGCGIRREAAAAIIIQTRTVMRGLDIRFSLPQSVFRLAAAGALYHSGSRSQNQNESLNTRSPIANFTDSLKLGPSKTNEW